jgi:hypothetical protein
VGSEAYGNSKVLQNLPKVGTQKMDEVKGMDKRQGARKPVVSTMNFARKLEV